MPDLALFLLVTWVAVLMLIFSIRSLTWHRISRFLQSILLLLVALACWQVITRDGSVSVELGLLFTFCGLLGAATGFVRGQTTPMHYDLPAGDVICRRGGLLSFCWAVVAVTNVTLLNHPSLSDTTWRIALPAALTFLTGAFVAGTLTIFSRVSALQRATLLQAQQETQVPH